MSADRFPHSERAIVDELGIAQKKLRLIRQDDLERGRDWDHVAGEVRYSDEGRARLLDALKIGATDPEKISSPPGDGPAAAPPEARAPAPLEERPPVPTFTAAADPSTVAMQDHTIDQLLQGTIEDLTCVKCFKPNRRILEARRANGAIVLVRVKDNFNLRPGMVMKCRFGSGRTWELNQRLPRYPGKW